MRAQGEPDNRAASIVLLSILVVLVQAKGTDFDMVAGNVYIGSSAQWYKLHRFGGELQDADAVDKDRLLVCFSWQADDGTCPFLAARCRKR